jgi:integrative and conjugative element protein (TIGR02256 family)
VYIGEWHTHPENFPSPSSVDVSSIMDSFKRNDRPLKDFILMAIVGREDIYWGFYDGIELKRVYPTYV